MRKLCLILLCLCLAIAPSCASAGETITIVVASDMHYLSPSLTDYGPSFMELLSAADGKMTHRTPEIMYAFAEEMIALGPDAVVLTGDLTLNGAPASHYDLDDILRRHHDFHDEILHVTVLDHLLDIHFYFVFVTGIGMYHIPPGLSVAS